MKMMCALNMWWWLDDWTDDDEGCKSFTDYMEGIIKPLVYDWMVEDGVINHGDAVEFVEHW